VLSIFQSLWALVLYSIQEFVTAMGAKPIPIALLASAVILHLYDGIKSKRKWKDMMKQLFNGSSWLRVIIAWGIIFVGNTIWLLWNDNQELQSKKIHLV